jgi:hypothetical protein
MPGGSGALGGALAVSDLNAGTLARAVARTRSLASS